MKSWRTTIGGCLIAVGTIAVQVGTPDWIPAVGTALVSVGAVIGGLSARDNKVTSKEAGAE